MEYLASPIDAEKCALRKIIEHEVQQFLEQGGRITVLNSPTAEIPPRRGGVWHQGGDGSVDSD
jgi:hypothetical protein